MRALAFILGLSFLVLGCTRDREIQTYRLPKPTPVSVSSPPNDHSGPLDWKIPLGWVEQPPSSMRYGSFLAMANGKKVDISIIPLAGPAGGDLANINRWRGQIDLEPLTDKNLPTHSTTLQFGRYSMLWVDFENKNQRIVAASYSQDDRTWFFKMTGESDAVKSVEPTFKDFLRSLHFHEIR